MEWKQLSDRKIYRTVDFGNFRATIDGELVKPKTDPDDGWFEIRISQLGEPDEDDGERREMEGGNYLLACVGSLQVAVRLAEGTLRVLNESIR